MSAVEDSKAEAERARARLEATIEEVRVRTRPLALLDTAKTGARKQAVKVAAAALASGRFRPVLALGVAATSIAYLFRTPILKVLEKRLDQGDDHE